MPPRLDAFLEAKLHPPAARTKWVLRDRLVHALERSTTDFPLTLVAAPAGYGKTTAVAQWLDQMTERSLAWVSLDSADNDPVRMWTHIATALERAKCVFVGGAAGLVAAHSREITDGLLPEIVNALADAPVPILLVLDDYHFVRADECHEQMDSLIEHLPPAAALLILTRADPALRLGRLRASAAARRDPCRSPVLRPGRDQGPARRRGHSAVRRRAIGADRADRRLARRAVPGRHVPDRS